MGNHIDSLIQAEMKQEIEASVSRSKRKKVAKVVTELKEKSPLKRKLQRAALFTALLSTAFLGETPKPYHVLAFILIVGGIVVSSRR